MQPKVYPSILMLSLLTLPLVWMTSALAHSTGSSLNSTSAIQSSLLANNTNKAQSGKGSNPTGNGIPSGKGSNSTGNGIQPGKGSNSTGNGIQPGKGSNQKGYKAGGSNSTGNGIQPGKGSNSTGNGIQPGKGSNSSGNGIQPGKGSSKISRPPGGNPVEDKPGIGIDFNVGKTADDRPSIEPSNVGTPNPNGGLTSLEELDSLIDANKKKK
jgi:hypothetical protein